jgi:hypothetical protein
LAGLAVSGEVDKLLFAQTFKSRTGRHERDAP